MIVPLDRQEVTEKKKTLTRILRVLSFPILGEEENIRDGIGSSVIGESLFTLFASLTYAYHYLMTLIK